MMKRFWAFFDIVITCIYSYVHSNLATELSPQPDDKRTIYFVQQIILKTPAVKEEA